MTNDDDLDKEMTAISDDIAAIDMLSVAMIYADYRDLQTVDAIMGDRFIRDCCEWTNDMPDAIAALRRGIEIELMRSQRDD